MKWIHILFASIVFYFIVTICCSQEIENSDANRYSFQSFDIVFNSGNYFTKEEGVTLENNTFSNVFFYIEESPLLSFITLPDGLKDTTYIYSEPYSKEKSEISICNKEEKKFRTANEKPKQRTSIHIGPKRGSAFFVFSNDLSNYTDAISEIRKNELWSSEKMIKKFSNMSYTFVFEPEQHNLEFIMSDAKPYFLETSFTRIKPSFYYLEAIKEFASNTFKYRYLIVFNEDASGNILDVSFSIIYHGKPPRW